MDLRRYEKGQIGCRWRTESEVLAGKGEQECGEVKCDNKAINVFEMNFSYVEEGQKRNALVKVSVCPQCAIKLNYRKALNQLH